MLPDRLEVIDLLAGANLGEHMIFLRLQLLGNQHPNRLSDGLG